MNSVNSDPVMLHSNGVWSSMKYQDCVLKSIGLSQSSSKQLIKDYNDNNTLENMLKQLYQKTSFFAFILRKNDEIFCAVDPTRSYPISFKRDQQSFGVGDFDLLTDYSTISSDTLDVDMFLSSGYFLRDRTISKDVASLPAGNYLIYKDNEYFLEEYHRYSPQLFNTENRISNDDELHYQLDESLNTSIQNTIEKANGRRIVLSLSAGLDSRLILSKLLENKYDNFECISWGPLGNGDSTGAARVASLANVPWSHIETDRNFCKSIFWSKLRKEFWRYSFNGVSIPSFHEFFVLCKLRNHKLYKPDNVLLVNGQAGDFNSGGHLPEIANVRSSDHLIDNFTQKHFGLFPKLLNSSNFLNNVKSELEMDSAINSNDIENLVYALDVFEFYERQSKWVINGQRSADFFGYSWDLPLWHPRLVTCFEQMDYSSRLNQDCLKSYIKNFDPYCLFQKEIKRPKWTGPSSMAIPIARLTGLLFGSRAKTNMYRYFAYYGINRDQFSVYDLSYFLGVGPSLRNIISLHVLTFIDEFSKMGIQSLDDKKNELL